MDLTGPALLALALAAATGRASAQPAPAPAEPSVPPQRLQQELGDGRELENNRHELAVYYFF
jgi:hypothetical protein